MRLHRTTTAARAQRAVSKVSASAPSCCQAVTLAPQTILDAADAAAGEGSRPSLAFSLRGHRLYAARLQREIDVLQSKLLRVPHVDSPLQARLSSIGQT